MGKKRSRPTVEEVLERPWCYYCERDFDDNKVLTNHQKLKHFKCNKCNRKLNTAGGLSVHMQQVHKETLTEVDNAIEGRREPYPEVFAMNGIPQELLDAHKQRIMNAFFAMEAEHRARTGNPPAGTGQPSSKRVKVEEETEEQLKARLAEHRARRKAEKEAKAAGITLPEQTKVKAESEPDTNEQVNAIPHPGQGMVGQPGIPPQPFAPQPFPPQGFSFIPPQGVPPHMAYPLAPLPFAQPGYPPTTQGYPPTMMAGSPVLPPHHSPYNASPYGPPSHHSPMPSAPLHSPMATAPRHSPRPMHTQGNGYSPPADGPSRQNSLPSAPGLPARPSFNSPNLSREEMQRMHEGQGPSAPKTGAFPTMYQPPQQAQQAQQTATSQKPPVAPEMMQSVADLIRSVKDELKEKAEKEKQEKERAAAQPTKYHALDGVAEVDGAGTPDTPNVLPLSKPKKSKKSSKDAMAKLIFDDNGTWISPEEKMATLSKYAFTRQNGAEYTFSEVGGAVTGTERGENDVVDPAH